MPHDFEEQQNMDRAIHHIFLLLLESQEFNDIVNKTCTELFNRSTPQMRATLKEYFKVKVGL